MEYRIEYKGFQITIDKETDKEGYFWIIEIGGEKHGSSGTLNFREVALDAKKFIDNIKNS